MRYFKDNLLAQFSIVSFLIMAVIALSLAHFLSNKLRSDAVDGLIDEAIGASSGRLISALTPEDLNVPMTEERYARFHDFVQQSIVSARTARVKIRARDGTIIYADDPEIVGKMLPPNEPLLKALAGETVTILKVPRDATHASEADFGRLMEVVTPIVFPGVTEPPGVFALYQYYEPTANRISRLRVGLLFRIGAGFSALYLSQLVLVWMAWRTITRQRSQLESTNADLEAENAQRRRAEEALAVRAQELERSNADLEQFAYVASHDLQEPLRAIAGFTKILGRRYQGRLDADADGLITRTVNAAARMQGLINDLLTYSRTGRDVGSYAPTDCATVVDQEIDNLKSAIDESGAVVTRDPLPTVVANASLLSQVFGNLISNAIKFRDSRPPQVHVSAERRETEWVFSVKDEGIGIDPQYVERIFIIFQRLHSPSEYVGTGIGLAVCKKAVQRLGGRIWVESRPGKGATFYFALPSGEPDGLVASALGSAASFDSYRAGGHR